MHAQAILLVLWSVVLGICLRSRRDGTAGYLVVVSFHLVSIAAGEVLSFGCDGRSHVAVDDVAIAIRLLWGAGEHLGCWLVHGNLRRWCWWACSPVEFFLLAEEELKSVGNAGHVW